MIKLFVQLIILSILISCSSQKKVSTKNLENKEKYAIEIYDVESMRPNRNLNFELKFKLHNYSNDSIWIPLPAYPVNNIIKFPRFYRVLVYSNNGCEFMDLMVDNELKEVENYSGVQKNSSKEMVINPSKFLPGMDCYLSEGDDVKIQVVYNPNMSFLKQNEASHVYKKILRDTLYSNKVTLKIN